MSVTGSALHWMPLTLPQLDFWEEFFLHPDEPLSTVAHYIELKGTVNEAALCRAIAQTAQETDVLALRFRLDDDGKTPLQAHDPARIPQVEENTSLRDYLTQTGKTLRQLYARGRYRVEQIARDQGVTENSRYFFSPFVNVLPFDPPQLAGCQVKHHVITSGPADGFNLTFRGQTNADGLVLSLDADSAAHPHDEFDQHAQRVMTFMQQVLDERYLDQPISALYDAIDRA